MDWIVCCTPTKADGNKYGDVISLAADGQRCLMNWQDVDLGQPWIPFCPPPAALGAAATTKPDTSTTCDLVDPVIHDDLFTPSSELDQQWCDDWYRLKVKHVGLTRYVATQAACWGADRELEACCKLLDGCTVIPVDGYASAAQNRLAAVDRVARLRAARRPQAPPSLKEQALKALTKIEDNEATYFDSSVIRRALEQLDD